MKVFFVLLLLSTILNAFCSYYFLENQYIPTGKNYKVCVYSNGSERIKTSVGVIDMCPYQIQYDAYNGYLCD